MKNPDISKRRSKFSYRKCFCDENKNCFSAHGSPFKSNTKFTIDHLMANTEYTCWERCSGFSEIETWNKAKKSIAIQAKRTDST